MPKSVGTRTSRKVPTRSAQRAVTGRPPTTIIMPAMRGQDGLRVDVRAQVVTPRSFGGSTTEGATPAGGLEVSEVYKRFRSLDVLRGISFQVARGEVVALLGANGAGKSTLIRILMGIITPDAGVVTIAEHDICHDGVKARSELAWVLGDDHGWYWRLTGRQNLTFFGMLRGLPKQGADLRAAEELERQGLNAASDTRVGEYSTGMRARLALARASLVPAAVLVLDEPGRGLDAGANEWLVEHLNRLRHTAVLLVTHDLEMVSRVADRSMILDHGELREQLEANTPASTLAARIEVGPR